MELCKGWMCQRCLCVCVCVCVCSLSEEDFKCSFFI